MSFLRLLTTGKSLVGLKDGHRYRVSREHALPRFEARANPFSHVRPVQPKPAGSGTEAAPVRVEGRWAGFLNRVRGWFGSKSQRQPQPQPRLERPAGSPAANGLVQAELSLEKVTVIRNDLSDSDLEIVPRQPAPLKAAPSAEVARVSAPPNLAAADSAWGRVSARFFGVGKS